MECSAIKSTGILVMLVVFVGALAGQTWGQAAVPPQAKLPAPGPEKGGLASLYPGDEGIEKDPRVIQVCQGNGCLIAAPRA